MFYETESKKYENPSKSLGEVKLNTAPYTSAPKVEHSDDFGLTEIPLDSKNSGTAKSENSFSLPTEVGIFIPEHDPIKMPYVEDGLSSTSEHSCASVLNDECKSSSTKNNDDIIINPSVIRDISKEIEELRMTINNTGNNVSDASGFRNSNTDLQKKPGVPMKRDIENSFSRETQKTEALENVSHSNLKPKTNKEYESDEDTDKLLTKPYEHNHKIDIPELKENNQLESERKRKGKEVAVRHPDYPSVLIEGLIFRANYLGSTQLTSESKLSRDSRMLQAQEAVGRVKAPDTESQPSVAVDLFISTEKILILNTNLTEIMMDHSLKTISYIADIGNILVLMARRIADMDSSQAPSTESSSEAGSAAPPSGAIQLQHHNKIICHVFESEEAQLIAQTIGNAFQVAYIEFLKANGIDDPKLFTEVDYQDVLNDQQIIGDELKMFSSSDQQKEVIIPKQKGEALGVVIVESGWGSMIPTVVLANMNPCGPAARCGLLNIGNQIISINGTSLVGLPLSSCQQIIKKSKNQTAIKLVIVSCPPVVEVNIRRPDPKYQLGFSVQNGVICSLLRGGIAERGGVRVGHHIIEINGISVVAMSHEKIVNILATSYGEIHLRTMPSSIFRLLTGQETPHYI